jgi:NADPH-dependent 2,4-dienoyl-CoA reductase/sulfur reductase-like enzyme
VDNVEALIRITVIEAGPRILPALPEHLAVAIAKLLHDLGVHIRSDTRVIEVSDGSVRLADKSFLDAEPVVWSARIKAPDFLKELDGREIDRINGLVVRESLQTTRDDHVFAIGDCASCVLPGDDKPLPPRAQTASAGASSRRGDRQKAQRAVARPFPLPRLRFACLARPLPDIRERHRRTQDRGTGGEADVSGAISDASALNPRQREDRLRHPRRVHHPAHRTAHQTALTGLSFSPLLAVPPLQESGHRAPAPARQGPRPLRAGRRRR